MSRTPQRYDFRRPNKFGREHVRTLQLVNDTFARQFTTVLSTTLRTTSQVSMSSLTQTTYDDFVRTAANPSLLAVLSMAPLPGPAVLQLPLQIAMEVVDRLLGGPGGGQQPERALSRIEAELLREFVQRVVGELTYAFETVCPVRPAVSHLDSDAQFMQLAPPSEAVLLAAFDVQIEQVGGQASLCIPYSTLRPVLSTTADTDGGSHDEGPHAARLRRRLHDVDVEVSVRFRPAALSSRDVLSLAVGDIVPLRHAVAEPLDLCVEDVPYLPAVPGSEGRRVACMVVER